MKPRLKAQILAALRKMFLFSDMHKNALYQAKVGPSMYKCAGCHCVIYSGKSEAMKAEHKAAGVKCEVPSVDHVKPVVPLSSTFGKWSWDTVINNLFCSEDNLQVLCKGCHNEKTNNERTERG